MAFTFVDFCTSGLGFLGLTSGFPSGAFFRGESLVAATGNGISFLVWFSIWATIWAVLGTSGFLSGTSERFWRFFVSLDRDDDREEVLRRRGGRRGVSSD